MLLFLIADFPGLCKLLNRGSNTGYRPCPLCMFTKVDCEELGHPVYEPAEFPGPARRDLEECKASGRHQDARKLGLNPNQAAHARGLKRHGISGSCEFDRLPYFNSLRDSLFDFMHVNSGVVGSHLCKLFAGLRNVAVPSDPRVRFKWGPDCEAKLDERMTSAAKAKKIEWRRGRVVAWEETVRKVEAFNKTIAAFKLGPTERQTGATLYDTMHGPRELTPGRRNPYTKTHLFKSHDWLMLTRWLGRHLFWETLPQKSKQPLLAALLLFVEVMADLSSPASDISSERVRDAFERHVFAAVRQLELHIPPTERCMMLHAVTHLPAQVGYYVIVR